MKKRAFAFAAATTLAIGAIGAIGGPVAAAPQDRITICHWTAPGHTGGPQGDPQDWGPVLTPDGQGGAYCRNNGGIVITVNGNGAANGHDVQPGN